MRLRPAWEDLRCYLTAKGRKRFEVYVCTMAERDYALEMWRLLDPESHLIGSRQILDRVICVKSGMIPIISQVFEPSLWRLLVLQAVSSFKYNSSVVFLVFVTNTICASLLF